jgi:hypothetical protein
VPLVVLTVVPLVELLLLVDAVPVVVPVAELVLPVLPVPVEVVVDDAALLQAVRATVPAREAATTAMVVARTFRSPISRRLRLGAVVLSVARAAVVANGPRFAAPPVVAMS